MSVVLDRRGVQSGDATTQFIPGRGNDQYAQVNRQTAIVVGFAGRCLEPESGGPLGRSRFPLETQLGRGFAYAGQSRESATGLIVVARVPPESSWP